MQTGISKPENNALPEWWMAALSVLRPPEDLTVSQWADKWRMLDSKTSAEPGRWGTDRTPYLRGVMDAFCDPDIEEIVFCKPTQVGGTEALNNMLGYIIDQDPAPTLFVYPTLELAEYTSKNRIAPMVSLCKTLQDKYLQRESKVLELQFDGMYIVLSGANSPASLASRPIRFLLMDEIDKFPANAGGEADPRKLAEERTKTFAHNKKIIKTSTPTNKSGPIWQEWQSCTRQMGFFVACPHCGHSQTFEFSQIKWPKGASPADAQRMAHYECAACAGRISDAHKLGMMRAGEWRTISGGEKKKTGFRINAIYSPWLRFGDIAREFLESKEDADTFKNFKNSWLAEPWEETRSKTDADMILQKSSGLPEGIVPRDTLVITGGVDVQRNGFYYTIRAWSERLGSANITHGFAHSWPEIEDAMNYPWPDEDGVLRQVNLCMIDSGDQTDEVYDFIVDNQEWSAPCKGSSRAMQAQHYNMSQIEKAGSRAFGMTLYIVDGGYYKDLIAGRIARDGESGWRVYEGCDRAYAEQVSAEEKVIERRGGRDIEVWKRKTSHAANHYLDAEVYAALAADVLGVRHMLKETEASAPSPTQQAAARGSWMSSGGNWLKKGGKWI